MKIYRNITLCLVACFVLTLLSCKDSRKGEEPTPTRPHKQEQKGQGAGGEQGGKGKDGKKDVHKVKTLIIEWEGHEFISSKRRRTMHYSEEGLLTEDITEYLSDGGVYEETSHIVKAYDAQGNLIQVSNLSRENSEDGARTSYYTYDYKANLKGQLTTIKQYDQADAPIQTIEYTWRAGRLQRIESFPAPGARFAKAYYSDFFHEGERRVREVRNGTYERTRPSTVITREYDSKGRLIKEASEVPLAPEIFGGGGYRWFYSYTDATYEYDPQDAFLSRLYYLRRKSKDRNTMQRTESEHEDYYVNQRYDNRGNVTQRLHVQETKGSKPKEYLEKFSYTYYD